MTATEVLLKRQEGLDEWLKAVQDIMCKAMGMEDIEKWFTLKLRRNTVTDEKRIEAIQKKIIKIKGKKTETVVDVYSLMNDTVFLLEYIEDMKLVELQQKDQENKEAMDKLVFFTEEQAEDMADQAKRIAYPKALFEEDRELFLINVINQMKAEGLRLLYKLTRLDK